MRFVAGSLIFFLFLERHRRYFSLIAKLNLELTTSGNGAVSSKPCNKANSVEEAPLPQKAPSVAARS
jgi:hypothetical protein